MQHNEIYKMTDQIDVETSFLCEELLHEKHGNPQVIWFKSNYSSDTYIFCSHYGRDFLVYYNRATEWIKQGQEPLFTNLD